MKQSRKLRVHGKDIHKFGKVPSLTTGLHKNDGWQTWGYRLKGKLRACTVMTAKGQGGIRGIAIWKGPITYLVFLQFPETNVRPLYMFSIARV